MTRANEERGPHGIGELPASDRSPAEASDDWRVSQEVHNLEDQGILPHKTPLKKINPALAEIIASHDQPAIIESPPNFRSEEASQGSISKNSQQSSLVGQYSLAEKRFAPNSAWYTNLDPVDITEDGRPIYPFLSGITGEDFKARGGIMRDPPGPKSTTRRPLSRRRRYYGPKAY